MAFAKPYRIEQLMQPRQRALPPVSIAPPALVKQPVIESVEDPRIDELVAAMRDLKMTLGPTQRQAQEIIDTYQSELKELQALRSELDLTKNVIDSTKVELASLRATEQTGQGFRRVSGELDAVIVDTEDATTRILAVTEHIETTASMMQAAGLEPEMSEMVTSILNSIATLYESCNFQDLTGQRISKVVKTLAFVEERVDSMISAWRGLDAFEALVEKHAEIVTPSNDDDPESLLNGPRLAEDIGHVSQDDIDALFD